MTTSPAPTRRFDFAPPQQQPRTPRSWYAAKVKPRVSIGGPPSVRRMLAMSMLALLSLLTLWLVFFVAVLSSLQEAHDQHNAYSLFREELTQLSHQTAPLGRTIAPDSPVALISAPRIDLRDVVIIEGTASGDLARGPGHKRNTPLPGQAGTSLVYGRANLFGGPFHGITSAKPGDLITVTTGQGQFKYRIEDVRRAGDPLPIRLPAGEGRLTLVTSEGGRWLNGFTPKRPVYVDAKLQGKSSDAPAGRPVSVAASENSMKGDIGALFTLVLWLPLLVFAGLAVVWAQEYWGRWHTWLVGAPVILAVLWGVSETAVQLLPNLM